MTVSPTWTKDVTVTGREMWVLLAPGMFELRVEAPAMHGFKWSMSTTVLGHPTYTRLAELSLEDSKALAVKESRIILKMFADKVLEAAKILRKV